MIRPSNLHRDTVAAISGSRAKALRKHGGESIMAFDADDPRWLAVLTEELGEVAHELTYDSTGDVAAELLDVLAVASAWFEARRDVRGTDGNQGSAVRPESGDLHGSRRGRTTLWRRFRQLARAESPAVGS